MSAITGALGSSLGTMAAGTFGWSAATWAQIGWTAGVLLGNYLFAPDGTDVVTEGPRLNDLKVITSTFGLPIPKVYGAYRVTGNILWTLPIRETRHEERQEEGKGGSGDSATSIWYTYSVTFAMALCEGPIAGIRKIWFGSTVVYDNGNSSIYNKITIYKGDTTQTPNWLIQADKPDTPAYRNTAYIVFNDIQLEDYGNRIPNISCEVIKNGESGSTYTYTNTTMDTTVEYYIPENIYGYTSHSALDIPTLDTIVTVPYLENNISNKGPNVYFIGLTPELDIVDINIIDFGETATINMSYISCSDDGNTSIFSIYTIDTTYKVYVNNVSTTFYRDYLSPEIKLDFKNPTTILYCNKNIILYDSYYVNIRSVPIYRYVGGTCDVTSCNVLSEFIAADELSDFRPYRLYSSNGLLFALSSIEYTGSSKIRVYDGDLGTRLYEFDCASDYTGASETAVCFFYDGIILYAIKSAGLLNSSIAYLDAYDLDTGYIETLNITMPTNLADIIESTVSFYIIHNKAYFITSTGNSVIAEIDNISTNGATVKDCLEDLSIDSGLLITDLDYTVGTDIIDGYVVSRNMTARSAIDPILSAYEYNLVENNHKIELRKQKQHSIINIPENHLGSNSSNNIEYSIAQELDLLKRLTVKYANPDSDYQTSVQSTMRTDVAATEERIVELALALSDNTAKQLSEKNIYQNWLMRKSYMFNLPFIYNSLVAGDIITINFVGYAQDVRLTKLTITEDNVIQCNAITHSYTTYISEAIGEDTGTNSMPLSTEIPNTKLVLQNIPTLDNTYISTEGIYCAVSGYTDGWKGCNILSKTQAIDNLAIELVVLNDSRIGQTHSILQTGPTHIWDLNNTVNVSIINGDLFDSTIDGVLNGANYLLIGKEIIQYKIATLITNNMYELSGLLRGRRGTESQVNSHSYGEIVVLLSASAFINKTINNNDIYATNSIGSSDTKEYGNFLYNGENLKPFYVEYLKSYRISNTAIQVNWMRRSRYISGYMNTLPVSESIEQYNIDVIKNSILINSYIIYEQNFTYTTTLATADGISVEDAITFEVSQISSIYGNGYTNSTYIEAF